MNKKIDEIIQTYNNVINVVDNDASSAKDRAYGGYLRATKGKLQEYITEEIVKIAWANIGGDEQRLSINSKKHKIPIQDDYIEKIDDKEIQAYLLENKAEYFYNLSVDKQVFIDDKFVIGIECKAYSENAMLKRILVDFSLLKTVFPQISCYLFQLESQLGGDHSDLRKITYGSKSTHVLMSYFPEVTLNIMTLLKGERKVDNPIHKSGGFKPLLSHQLKKAVLLLQQELARHMHRQR